MAELLGATPIVRAQRAPWKSHWAKRTKRRSEARRTEAFARNPVCPGCGKAFDDGFRNKGGRPRRYCTQACGDAHHALKKRKPPRPERPPPSSAVWFRHCVQCGTLFTARLNRRRLCRVCVAAGVAYRAARVVDRRINRDCDECGRQFTPSHSGSKSFCSRPCRSRHYKRIEKAVRRARKRTALIELVIPLKVFERDGWRCHLCGRKTLKAQRGSFTHPQAPTLDHIVPVAQGGEHTYRNTACACRACNTAKGARERGQLRLFG